MQISSEELLIQIRNQITAYQLNVKSDNKARRYNINDRAESFTIPLFKILFGWNNLIDLNKNKPNFPGIDLGDFDNRVAVQVTSETSLEKVKDTLNTFVKYKYYDNFERLVIFMLQGKQSSYSQGAIDNICNDQFTFNATGDIIDLSGLMQFIKSLTHKELEEILTLFQEETGISKSTPLFQNVESENSIFSAPNNPPFETGMLNLFEIGFPEKLFISDWNFTKKQLGTRKQNDRKLVQEALNQQKLKFAVDWVTFEKRIITFHDLNDELVPLAKVVDIGTLEELETQEFYENSFYRNKFVELLQKCLQQKLFQLGIQWQHQEKEYIFVPLQENDILREIEWKDIKTDTRTVYKQIANLKDDTKVYCHEHFAFFTRFYEFDQRWYLAIMPDWFYSSDGYFRARYAIEDKRKYKKQVEANLNVSTHVRFINSFISTNDSQNSHQLALFSDTNTSMRPYEFLWIKSLEEIDHMPRLPDSEWKPLTSHPPNDSETMFS